VVFLCNPSQEAAFAKHCNVLPAGFTSQVKKYYNCKSVPITAGQIAWGKQVCLNKALSAQKTNSVVYLCNPSQEKAYYNYCNGPKPGVCYWRYLGYMVSYGNAYDAGDYFASGWFNMTYPGCGLMYWSGAHTYMYFYGRSVTPQTAHASQLCVKNCQRVAISY